MQTLTFQGKRMAYYLDGEGTQVLVLLHGLCEDSTIWEEFIQDLPLSQYLIVRIDLSGFGNSEILPQHSIDLMSEAVKTVLDALNVEKAVLIGHSLGGYVATAFAKKYSDRLLGLGLFHSHPFADTAEKRQSRQKAIDFIHRNGHILYVKQFIPSLFAELFATSNEFLMNALILKASRYPAEAITGAHEAMMHREDNSEVIANLTCPVLFIIGKQDLVIPYEVSLRQMSLPTIADIHILPKVAHMGMYRAKEETTKIVTNFMHLCQN